jgi:hypothetical protein
MAVVKGFDAGLQCECDKEADRDRHQVKEEVAPSPRRVMSRMNFHLPSPRITGWPYSTNWSWKEIRE